MGLSRQCGVHRADYSAGATIPGRIPRVFLLYVPWVADSSVLVRKVRGVKENRYIVSVIFCIDA